MQRTVWRFLSKLRHFNHNEYPTVHNVAQAMDKYFAVWYFLRKFARGYGNIFIMSGNLPTIAIRVSIQARACKTLVPPLPPLSTKNTIVNNSTLSKFAIFYVSSFISIPPFVIFTR